MYKILLVDDEYLETRALSIILEERSGIENIKIVGEAVNGEEAVLMAKKYRPDIVFIDVKMPKINGLEAVKMIKDFADETKFVMLTAYDEFDYVKEALNLDVDEYLLKPVKPKKVIEVSKRLIAEIESKNLEEKIKKDMKDKLKKLIPYIKMSFVFDLIFMNIDSLAEIKSRAEFFEMDKLPAAVMVADIDKFVKTTVNQNELERQILKKKVFNIINSFSDKYPSLMIVPMFSDKSLILYFGEEKYKNKQIKNWLRQTAEKMAAEVSKKTDFTLTIGIGSYYDDPRQVDRSYYEALGATRNSILFKGYSVVHWEDIKNIDDYDIAYPYDIENKIVESFKSGDMDKLPALIDRLFEDWEIKNNSDSMLIKSRILELMGVLSRSAVEVGANFKEISPINYKYSERLFDLDGVSKLKDWLNSLLTKLSEKIDLVENDIKNKLIYNGIKFIKSNYKDDITLTETAAAANLSEHYFSRLFKKEMDCTFKEYITELRIKEAKRILKNLEINISTIAKETGYNDASYFSKVFKKYEGVSPSKYRDLLN